MTQGSTWCCPVVIDVGTSYTKAGALLPCTLCKASGWRGNVPQARKLEEYMQALEGILILWSVSRLQ
jgi:hypothetical protein